MIPNLKNGSYKGMFNFYLEPNAITTASKRVTLLTLIGQTAYGMLANLHLPNELSKSTSIL